MIAQTLEKVESPEPTSPATAESNGAGPPPREKSFRAFVVFCAKEVQEFLTNNSMQMAAALAFYSFFSLFPLSLLIIIGYDLFQPEGPIRDEQLTRVIGTFIPVSQTVIAQTVSTGARTVTIGPLALLGLIWASTAVFATLRKGINVTWNVRVPRPFLRERFIDLTLTAGSGLLFMLLLYSTSVIRQFDDQTGVFGGAAWQSGLSLGITFIAFSFIFWFLPNRLVRFRDVLFGAAITAIAFEVAKAIFFNYTRQRGDLDQVYGSLSSVMLLMGWLYISAAIVLIGSLTSNIYTRLIQLQMVSHLDVWSFGMLPASRHLWRRWFPTPVKRRASPELPQR